MRLLLLLLLWQQLPGKQDVVPTNLHNQSGHKQDASPIAAPVNDGSPCVTCGEKSSQNTNNAQPWWKNPTWVNIGLTGLYTFFSAGMLVAIFCQNRSIQNAERAFLIPVWDDDTWINPSHHSQGESMNCCFKWRFKNCGKTPAFIRQAWGTVILVDDLSKLPKRPDYGEGWKFLGDPVIPDAHTDEGPFLAELNDPRPYHEIQSIYCDGSKVLFAYGYVLYEDMFGRAHETRFGVRLAVAPRPPYSSRDDRFVIAGPNRYNKYT